MKWVALLATPTLGIAAAFKTLIDTVTVATTTAIDTGNLALMATSTNALATGVLITVIGLLAMVFLCNAALALMLTRHP